MSFVLALALALVPQDTPRKLTAGPDRRIELDLSHYYAHSELGLWLNALAAAYPEFVALESLGKSAGGEELWLVTVAEKSLGDPAARPAMLVTGALGREDVAGSELALATILELVQNHARDEKLGALLETTTLYVAPCVDPDLRERIFAELEGQAPTQATSVELAGDFPIGWDPARSEATGPYPLFRPEARALASFLLAHPNVAVVQHYAPARDAGEAARTVLPPLDSAHYASLARDTRALGPLSDAEPRGLWRDFAYRQAGCFALEVSTHRASRAGELPAVDALYELSRESSRKTLALLAALPRLALGEATVKSLGGDQWRVAVTLSNTGALPTNSELGREHFACAPPRISLEGARVVASIVDGTPLARASASLSLSELQPGERVEVAWIVSGTPDGELTLSATAPRAGSANARAVLR